jgi:hypothetical protein
LFALPANHPAGCSSVVEMFVETTNIFPQPPLTLRMMSVRSFNAPGGLGQRRLCCVLPVG